MARNAPEITVKPEVMLLEDVLREIAHGILRVPRFQRPFVWRPEQMLNLFDSIERGYPIGSLLVWETPNELASLDHVAGLPLPDPPDGRPASYVLDGHQRLSTLFGTLWTSRGDAGRKMHDWPWTIYRDLEISDERAVRFRHWRRSEPPPSTLMPMHAALRTMDFLAYARQLEGGAYPAGLSELVDEAEQTAQRIKSYRVAVVRLVGGSLNQAVEVFSRLNSSGSSMSPDLMVSALTYSEGESLAERIAAIQDSLAEEGFAGVESLTAFRSILAVMGEEDILQARWDVLARRVQGQLEPAIEQSAEALSRAASFLRTEVGVPSARLLPYAVQLVLLAAFFARQPDPSSSQRSDLQRWFWETSWSGYFAGANTTQVKDDLKTMKRFAVDPLASLQTGEAAAAFPDRYDLRSARVRTFLIWFLRAYPTPLDLDGKQLDPIIEIARADTAAFRHVVPSSVQFGSSPANRIIFPTPHGVSVRRALVELDQSIESAVIASHCIPAEALSALRSGDDVRFVTARAAVLRQEELRFMSTQGVRTPAERTSEPLIDT